MTIIYTIGHGNRSLADFIDLLTHAGVTCVVDVRAYPHSRRNPHFSRTPLMSALNASSIRYMWEDEALGGMRRSKPDSPHVALTDAGFRGFADHMASREFQAGVTRVLAASESAAIALMCAETNPEHCHRGFIADALLVRGARVLHLISAQDVRCHSLRAGARLTASGTLLYDAATQLALTL